MIEPGSTIPSVPVRLINRSGINDADSATVLSSGKVVLFTLPGAFTPTCHANHLPGYIELADEIKAAGVDRIVCATVNDQYVVEAWADVTDAIGKVEFIADGNADFARALGLDADLTPGGLGTRFIRAAIVINDGIVQSVYTEDAPGRVTSSGAPAILKVLNGGTQ